MTQEDKELLLKDLCVRLPYGVKLLHTPTNEITNLEMIGNGVIDGNIHDLIENFKPYLFPLSSMTEEQSKIYHELIGGMFGTSALINFEVLEDFFHKNHIFKMTGKNLIFRETFIHKNSQRTFGYFTRFQST